MDGSLLVFLLPITLVSLMFIDMVHLHRNLRKDTKDFAKTVLDSNDSIEEQIKILRTIGYTKKEATEMARNEESIFSNLFKNKGDKNENV